MCEVHTILLLLHFATYRDQVDYIGTCMFDVVSCLYHPL